VATASSMDDVIKVVAPNSVSEEDEIYVCKHYGEVHDVKDIEEYRRIHLEQSIPYGS
jgi:hypothetical protein